MKLLSGIFLLLLACNLHARGTADYLPADADPDPAIPTPESILGWEVGDWHVSHDKLVQYMQALAAASPRVSIKVTGHTYEQRPLLLLTITSAENQQNLEELRQAHLASDGPLVTWLGYSVHGNEASGSNASILAAYYLAAGAEDKARLIAEDMKDEPNDRLLAIRDQLARVTSKDFWEIIDRGRNFEYMPPAQRACMDQFFDWLGVEDPEDLEA